MNRLLQTLLLLDAIEAMRTEQTTQQHDLKGVCVISTLDIECCIVMNGNGAEFKAMMNDHAEKGGKDSSLLSYLDTLAVDKLAGLGLKETMEFASTMATVLDADEMAGCFIADCSTDFDLPKFIAGHKHVADLRNK